LARVRAKRSNCVVIAPARGPVACNEAYVRDPRQETAAVDQIVRRCGKLGTTLTMSGGEMIVWTKP
jgi:hypothetical protein